MNVHSILSGQPENTSVRNPDLYLFFQLDSPYGARSICGPKLLQSLCSYGALHDVERGFEHLWPEAGSDKNGWVELSRLSASRRLVHLCYHESATLNSRDRSIFNDRYVYNNTKARMTGP